MKVAVFYDPATGRVLSTLTASPRHDAREDVEALTEMAKKTDGVFIVVDAADIPEGGAQRVVDGKVVG